MIQCSGAMIIINNCWSSRKPSTAGSGIVLPIPGFDCKFKLGSSKLCEFCIYRVSFLTGTPLKVSVYNVNCAEKGQDAHHPRLRIDPGCASAPGAHHQQMRITNGCASPPDAHHPRMRITPGCASPPDAHHTRMRITPGCTSTPDAHQPRICISRGCPSATDAH